MHFLPGGQLFLNRKNMFFNTRPANILLCITLTFNSLCVYSQAIPEWQDPQVISINTERPHADFIPYPTEKAALAGDRKAALMQSLNGNWKFKWASHPSKAQLNFYDPNISDAAWET